MSSKQAASKLLGEVFRRQKPKLTHQQVVMRMYRQGLRECRNWNTSHVGYRASCIEIREEFDKYTNVSNPVEIKELVARGHALLKEWKHPNPYIPPEYEGGTKDERNVPVPIQHCELDDDEFKWYYGYDKPADYDPRKEY